MRQRNFCIEDVTENFAEIKVRNKSVPIRSTVPVAK